MGLLDGGLAGIFGAAFSGIYLPGTLHRATLTRGADKRVTGTGFDDVPMRYQPNAISAEARARAGIPADVVLLLILSAGLGPSLTTEDEVTIDTGRYRILSASLDPARSHYDVRAVPTDAPEAP
ncbi:hypothetical protein [Methylobacterium tarhaniae]|uniref:hypothetical protein n=1 Tax=Methylobacterium tarhaniae TaxID=1187852 RepID=UPI003D00BBA2